MRMLEQSFLEGLLGSAIGRAHYAGKQADASIEYGERRRLPARQHYVRQAHLLNVASLENPLVETLEPAAQDRDPRPGRKLANAGLRDWPPAWRHREHGTFRLALPRMIDRRCKDIGLEHHSRSAARRSVVHRPVPVGREVADLHCLQRPDSLAKRPSSERYAERAGKHLRIER